MMQLGDKLQAERFRSSTAEMYYRVWKSFNQFVLRLDIKPIHMEDRLMLYVAFLIQTKKKSTTVKSYVSAIKAILDIDGHPINENKTIIKAMTKACRLKSDKALIRFPIRKNLLNQILGKIEDVFDTQPYLCTLYKTIFAATYYGLFRIGEVTLSQHIIKAVDVLIGRNKPKMMFVLFLSKTHTFESKPQIVKIASIETSKQTNRHIDKNKCPFQLLQNYVVARPTETSHTEPFFVFSDRSPVMAKHMRAVLKLCLKLLNYDSSRYFVHGIRAGRALDLLDLGLSVETIKQLGRWKSNAVFTYLSGTC